MNIGFIFNQFGRVTGIPSVVINTVNELKKIGVKNNYYSVKCSNSNIDIEGPSTILSDSDRDFVDLWSRGKGIDIYHSFYPPFDGINITKQKTILTIHDMIPLKYPQWFANNTTNMFDKQLRESAKRADVIIAVSEATKVDVAEIFGIEEKKIKVVYNGINNAFSKDYFNTDILKKLNLEADNYILSVSTLEPRKNMRGLIKAFEAYVEETNDIDKKLVFVGMKGWDYEFATWLDSVGKIKNQIVIAGYLSDEELSDLYNKARAVAYVSFYEGFGLPVLEGMTLGKAVICSNTSSIPEVGGNAVCYCNPYEIESMTEAIHRVICDDKYRESLEQKAIIQANKFSYSKAAEEILSIYKELV